eukprot:scaffold889_cov268-Pinguiococcus_pyrenoidosus.AAC.15
MRPWSRDDTDSNFLGTSQVEEQANPPCVRLLTPTIKEASPKLLARGKRFSPPQPAHPAPPPQPILEYRLLETLDLCLSNTGCPGVHHAGTVCAVRLPFASRGLHWHRGLRQRHKQSQARTGCERSS